MPVPDDFIRADYLGTHCASCHTWLGCSVGTRIAVEMVPACYLDSHGMEPSGPPTSIIRGILPRGGPNELPSARGTRTVSRLLPPTRRSTEQETTVSPTSSDERSSRSGLRKAILALGIIAIAYVARRRARSGGAGRAGPSTDQLREKMPTDRIREKAGEALPEEAAKIPIGNPGGDETESDDTGTGSVGTDRDAPAGTDRTLEEADERTEMESPEEPGAAGEGTVEEETTGSTGDDGSSDGDDEDEPTDHGIQ